MGKKFEFLDIYVSRERNFYLLKNGVSNEFLELILYVTMMLLLPLLFHVQLVTGILVNAILVKAALDYNYKKVALLSVIPSISVLAGGFLFGGLTQSLFLVLPFIWIGNFLLAFGVKKMFVEEKANYLISIIISSIVKSTIIFTGVFILFSISMVPELFLTVFGIMQLATAMSGGILMGLLRMKKII